MAHVATVTIDNTKVAADLTDFPVYINLADLPAGFWSVVANGGGDIRCYKSDGTTELAREVVSCDTATDTGELHVKYSGTLSGSVDTVIQIHADGSSADYAVDATYGRNAVWSGYSAVYHLNSDATNSTGGTAASESKDNWGDSNISYSASDGKIGAGGGAFNGSSSKIYTNINMGKNPTFTTSCWFKSSYSGTDYINLLTLCDSQTGNTTSQIYYFVAGSNDLLGMEGGGISKRGTTDVITGGWFYGGWRQNYSANTTNLFVNGSSEANDVAHSSNINTWARISVFGGNGGFFNGSMDEVRLTSSALSNDWITTEYNNQSSPSTFYAVTAPATGYTNKVMGVAPANIGKVMGVATANISKVMGA